jgi:hypothetical protein
LGKPMLMISFQDLRRATLPFRSGNEGWIGVSPEGTAYHVVVPVDVQIARGVMACNRPTDGTPFGGYSGWLYFRCPQYDESAARSGDENRLRIDQARKTADQLVEWLASCGVAAKVVFDAATMEAPPGIVGLADKRFAPPPAAQGLEIGADIRDRTLVSSCQVCRRAWTSLAAFLRDPELTLTGYRACLEDFRSGVYLFSHQCTGTIEVSVSRFARTRVPGRSLAGTHACPGFCYYETSFLPCEAICDGSVYRRVAHRLKVSRREPVPGRRARG